MEIARTRDDLFARYPGVNFHGELGDSYIDTRHLRIDANAVIYLGVVQITGQCYIGAHAEISGGSISHSDIDGQVNDGDIRHSYIGNGCIVSHGIVAHSTVDNHSLITGGTIKHSNIRDGASVTGGIIEHSTISDGASISGGVVKFSTVENHASIEHGHHIHMTINGNSNRQQFQQIMTTRSDRFHVSRARSSMMSSGNRFAHMTHGEIGVSPPNIIFGMGSVETDHSRTVSPEVRQEQHCLGSSLQVNREERFNCEPPPGLIDEIISFDLIHEAVSTKNGDDYDRPVIERYIRERGACPVTRNRLELSDLRPNRRLQRAIDEWKDQQRRSIRTESVVQACQDRQGIESTKET